MRPILLSLLLWFASAAQAAVVFQDIRPGIRAGASYQVGEHNKPAILLLHGFLQTREFPTVATLAGGLHDAGYNCTVAHVEPEYSGAFAESGVRGHPQTQPG
jgi:hypothetical protein